MEHFCEKNESIPSIPPKPCYNTVNALNHTEEEMTFWVRQLHITNRKRMYS